jgi:gliding motility-associated-like protein
VDIGPDVFLNLGDTLQLKAVLNNYAAVSYRWQILDWQYHLLTDVEGAGITRFFNRQITSTIFANLGGYALVIATDSLGCTATDTLFFKLQDKYEVYIPNVFTPNNDGLNDLFTAYGGASAKNIRLMRIFDRWGELIYEGKDLPVGGTRSRETWNGSFKEQPLNTAVFSYYIEVEFIDNTTQHYTGDVTLLR